jgi:hypothetical protein
LTFCPLFPRLNAVVTTPPNPNSTQVSFYLQTDLKGTLPNSVRNTVSEGMALIVFSLRKFLLSSSANTGTSTPRPDLYACSLASYTNQQVEMAMDSLNRRVLAADASGAGGPPASPLRRVGSGLGVGGGGGGAGGGGLKRAALHQRAPTIGEIQSSLAPHIEAQVEDAVYATLEREASFPFRSGQRRCVRCLCVCAVYVCVCCGEGGGVGWWERSCPLSFGVLICSTRHHHITTRPPSADGEAVAGGDEAGAEGWEVLEERAVSQEKGDRDWSYLNERDATDVSVLNVCSEGVIRHPPAAVLKASV